MFFCRLDANGEADSEELKARKKTLEESVTPIISKLYATEGGQQPPPGGEAGGAEKDEL